MQYVYLLTGIDPALSEAAGVICVGAINSSYEVEDFSSVKALPTSFYLAPGVNIMGTSFAGDNYTETSYGGTSIAAPFVAGAAAIFMSYLGLAAGGVDEYLSKNAIQGICTRPGGGIFNAEQNRLVNTGIRHPDREPDTPFVGAPEARVSRRAECKLVGKS